MVGAVDSAPETVDPEAFVAEVRAELEPHLAAVLPDGPALPEGYLEHAARFCEALRRANERVNLTGIRDARGMARLHVLDSLVALPLVAGRGPLMDLGSGCGVPGLPLGLALPDTPVELVESRQRKAATLGELVDDLHGQGLAPQVSVSHARGEQWLDLNEVGVVLTRAVGDVASQLELLAGRKHQFGTLLMLKGPGADEELEKARPRLGRLGFAEPERHEVELPDGAGRRILLAFAGEG